MASPIMILQMTRVSDDRVYVLTIKSPKGEPKIEVTLPFNEIQRKAITLALEAQTFKPSDWDTPEGAQYLDALKKMGLVDDNGFVEKMQQCIGSFHFNAFFPPGPLLEALHETIDRAGVLSPARIELRFDVNAADLGLYPWELLYDTGHQEFLFSGRTSGIVRYIACTKPVPDLLTTESLRVLFVAARPVDPSQVQPLPDQEDAAIGQGLAETHAKKSISLDILPPISAGHSTYALLTQALHPEKEDQRAHVLHFDGHGGFGILCKCGRLNHLGREFCFYSGCNKSLVSRNAQGYLAFERTDKTVDWVSAEKFANLLKGAGVRLVVLSACKSAVAAGESVFSGVAPALIGAGIPAVVAMQYSISAAASNCFAEVFYRSLGQHSSLIAAMGEVRTALFGEFQESWYRPVLYLRVDEANPEGCLFESNGGIDPIRRIDIRTAAEEELKQALINSSIDSRIWAVNELRLLLEDNDRSLVKKDLQVLKWLLYNESKQVSEKAKEVLRDYQKRQIQKWIRRWWVGGVLVLVLAMALIVLAIKYYPRIRDWISAAVTTTEVVEVTTSETVTTTPTITPIPPTATETPTVPIPPTSSDKPPAVASSGDTWVSPKDGMTLVYVPAGDFLMGSVDSDSIASDDEKPQHKVTLDAFWIDQTEVTAAMYEGCVNGGNCQPAIFPSTNGLDPITGVSWNDANQYCEWAGRRLPTETEWEKAARGTDGRIYPWGNNFNGLKLNFCDVNCSNENANMSFDDGFSKISPVGSFPNGASPYGLLDMAGNVWEWVKDWYLSTYYQYWPSINPQGPVSGEGRVIRGGAYDSASKFTRTTYREFKSKPDQKFGDIGFRCAASPGP